MALFHRALPRRALLGAFVGFVYGLFIMPTAGSLSFAAGAGWALLSVSLLFGKVYAYYTYVTWALLWIAWRATLAFQGAAGHPIGAAIDVLLPLLSIALLSSAGYVEAVKAAAVPEE